MGGSVYTKSIPQGPNAGSYSWYGGYGGHFLVDNKRGSAMIAMIPSNTGPKSRELEYELSRTPIEMFCLPRGKRPLRRLDLSIGP